MDDRSFDLTKRSDGDWMLQLLENGEEVGGGVFPDEDYGDALFEGEAWIEASTVN